MTRHGVFKKERNQTPFRCSVHTDPLRARELPPGDWTRRCRLCSRIRCSRSRISPRGSGISLCRPWCARSRLSSALEITCASCSSSRRLNSASCASRICCMTSRCRATSEALRLALAGTGGGRGERAGPVALPERGLLLLLPPCGWKFATEASGAALPAVGRTGVTGKKKPERGEEMGRKNLLDRSSNTWREPRSSRPCPPLTWGWGWRGESARARVREGGDPQRFRCVCVCACE